MSVKKKPRGAVKVTRRGGAIAPFVFRTDEREALLDNWALGYTKSEIARSLTRASGRRPTIDAIKTELQGAREAGDPRAEDRHGCRRREQPLTQPESLAVHTRAKDRARRLLEADPGMSATAIRNEVLATANYALPVDTIERIRSAL